MHDIESLIAGELERLAPAGVTGSGWDDAVARAGGARRRGWRAPLLAATLVAAAVPALAFSAGLRSLLGFTAPHPILAKAYVLVSAPLGNGLYGHFWHAPSSGGGQCMFLSFDHAAVASRPRGNGGGACTLDRGARIDTVSKRSPLVVGLSIQRRLKGGDPSRWVPPSVNGAVFSGLRATRVEIRWRGGHRPLVLRNGYFIGGGRYLYLPPFGRFPFFVVVYDARGHVVARRKLDSPTLRLMSHGWKEYARAYHAWQRAHP
jgi:hypothetical protein